MVQIILLLLDSVKKNILHSLLLKGNFSKYP